MSTIQCNIVSPEGELFSGPVELLSAEGGAGEIAITPRHAPLLTNLKPGPVKLVLEGGEEEYKQIAMMHAACLMSVKYKIDIQHFLWKVVGVKSGTYDKYLELLDHHGVEYYTQTS